LFGLECRVRLLALALLFDCLLDLVETLLRDLVCLLLGLLTDLLSVCLGLLAELTSALLSPLFDIVRNCVKAHVCLSLQQEDRQEAENDQCLWDDCKD
jgi:hypothetical protein